MSLLKMPTTGHSTRPIWTSDARMPIWALPFLRGSQNATFGAGAGFGDRARRCRALQPQNRFPRRGPSDFAVDRSPSRPGRFPSNHALKRR